MDLPELHPPVLSPASIKSLDEYRRFRHVVRNAYTENLDSVRVGQLAAQLSKDWSQIQNDLDLFARFLENVSRADDTD